MGNIEIILIVFGSSALIVIVLIVFFHWLGIRVDQCCFNREKPYVKNNSQNNFKINQTNNLNNNNCTDPQSKFNQIWNSERALSLISVDTIETTDNFDDTTPESNNIQLKPNLKHMIACNTSIILDENLLDISIGEYNDEKMDIELNYNPLEQYLELDCIETKLNFSGGNNNGFKYNQSYLVVWLNNDTKSKQKSKIISLELNILHFNSKFRWPINDVPLMKNGINIMIYLINSDTKQEILFRDSFFTVGDVYRYQPISIKIPIYDIEKKAKYAGDILLSLSYLPTAERLTVVIIEGRNLKLETKYPSADTYVKISLIDSNGTTKEAYRTSYRKNYTNPIFNEYAVFKVTTKHLNSVSIKVIAYEKITESIESILGIFYIGANRRNYKGMEINEAYIGQIGHWQQMLRSLRRPVSLWHCLER